MELYESKELVGTLISMEFNSTGQITQLWSADPTLPEEGEEFQFILPPISFNEERAENYYPGTILIGARTSCDSPWIVSRNVACTTPYFYSELKEEKEVSPSQISFEYEFPFLPEIKASGTYYEDTGPIPQIIWEIELNNISDSSIEIGELGFPLAFNNFYEGFGWSDEQLKTLWNSRLYIHQFIGGAASWLFAQRMTAEPPGLLIFPGENTEWEFFTHVPGSLSTSYHWEGIPIVYIHSKAIVEREGWVDWVNPHTSLILEPGKSKKYRMHFVATEHSKFDGIYNTLTLCKKPAIKLLPGAVAPTEVGIAIEIAGCVPTKFTCNREDVVLETDSDENGGFCFVQPQCNGPFEIIFEDTQGQTSYIHLMFIDPLDEIIKKRGEFIEKYQTIRQEDSPLNHAIYLTNTTNREIITQESECMGASSIECSLADALYLAAKNTIYPLTSEIQILDEYIEYFLLEKIQNPSNMAVAYKIDPTFMVGLCYGKPHVYCYVFNLYHQMYQISGTYGSTKQDPHWYLLKAYKTVVSMFKYGWRNYVWSVGLPGFSRVYELIKDLESENFNVEAQELSTIVTQKAQTLMKQEFPYAGESALDTSGCEDIFMAALFLSNEAHMDRTAQCTFAARSLAPSWWWYGSDKRCWDQEENSLNSSLVDHGEVCLAHTTIPNSLIFFEGLDKDYITLPEAHMRGAFGGMLAPWALIRKDGAASTCYTSDLQSKHYGYNNFTGTLGIGLFMYLKNVGSYVLPNQGGDTYTFGCHFERKDNWYVVTPWDGVGQKIVLRQIGLEVYLNFGKIKSLKFHINKKHLELIVENPVDKTIRGRLTIKGMWGTHITIQAQQIQNREGKAVFYLDLEPYKTHAFTFETKSSIV